MSISRKYESADFCSQQMEERLYKLEKEVEALKAQIRKINLQLCDEEDVTRSAHAIKENDVGSGNWMDMLQDYNNKQGAYVDKAKKSNNYKFDNNVWFE